MKWNMIISALLVSASLCGQSFGSNLLNRKMVSNGCDAAVAPPCNVPAAAAPACEAAAPSCAQCNPCCKSLCEGLKNYFNCRFPCGPALVIKPISCHRCCR